jgi:hypothetical protein
MPNRYDWLVRRCDCGACKKNGRVSWVGEIWDLHTGEMVDSSVVDNDDDRAYLIKNIGMACLGLERQASGLMTGSST